MNIGYFKLHRELFEKEIWIKSTPEQKTILITLLGMVNYKEAVWDYQGEHYHVQPGQVVTSIPKIVASCGKGISEQNVRTALKRFEKLDFLTDEPMTKNKNRLITIKNWGIYQCKNEEKTGENLTDTLTDTLTDKLTDTKDAETVDTKGIVSDNEKNLTDTLTDYLTDDLNPKEEVKEIKNKDILSSKPDKAFPFDEIVNYLNQKCGTNYKANTKATQKHIKARISEGFTSDDIKRVIDIKQTEWTGTDMEKYLRPETLFGTKFESYLNQNTKTAPTSEAVTGQAQITRVQPTDFSIIQNEGDW